jgi:type II secretory pathway component PulF
VIEAIKALGRFGRKPKKQAFGRKAPRPRGLLAKFTAAGDRMAFSWSVREGLYRHLSAQVGNGIPVETALDNFRLRLQRRKKLSSDKIIGDVARRMRDGSTLAKALAPWAPRDEVGIVSSGELSGNLPRSLDLVIEAKRRVARVNRALKAAMVSPAIYLALVYGMLWTIGKFVTPGLQQALPRESAKGMVAGLYAAGDFANSWWALLPPLGAGLLAFAVMRSLPAWTGKQRIAAERFFPFSFYRDMQGYTWLMSFSALLRAGMPDVEILKRQAADASPWLKERLHALWWRTNNGASLPDAMLARGRKGMPPFGFPNPDIVDDIASMAGFADFAERIADVAVQWADDLEASTLARAKTFGFVMEVVMYGVMGFLMVAINSMSTQMGSIPGM